MEIDFCPRWVLSKLGIPEQSQYHFALLVSALFALALVPVAICIPHFCLMRQVLGIPCPGCGILHSTTAILRLNPVGAWKVNPAGFAVVSCFCFQLLARPVAIIVPRTGNGVSAASRLISNVTLGALLLVWTSRVI